MPSKDRMIIQFVLLHWYSLSLSCLSLLCAQCLVVVVAVVVIIVAVVVVVVLVFYFRIWVLFQPISHISILPQQINSRPPLLLNFKHVIDLCLSVAAFTRGRRHQLYISLSAVIA